MRSIWSWLSNLPMSSCQPQNGLQARSSCTSNRQPRLAQDDRRQLNAGWYSSAALALTSFILGVFVVWDLASKSNINAIAIPHHSNAEIVPATHEAIRSISPSNDGQFLDVVQGATVCFRRDAHSGDTLGTIRLSPTNLPRFQNMGDAKGWVAINSQSELELIRDGVTLWRSRLPEQYDDEVLIECDLSGARNRIAVASKQGSLWILEVDSAGIVLTSQSSVGVPLADMKASSASDQLALISANREVLIWDIDREQVVRRIPTGDQDVRFARWSQDGRRLVTFGSGGVIKVWDADSGHLVHQVRTDAQLVVAAELSADGNFLAAGDGNLIRVWNLSDRDELWSLDGHTGMVSSLAFMDQGSTLFSGDLDGSLRRWSITDGQERWTVR
ncbi:WD40 repeat domain-containing protein [Schlesneria paludicola]|uniref:WD40 repeat domain-containing protein n=1 Tax=Schlesneria paludicola TaxID=360056 RepID=UPI00029A011A|nr:PQQ-binding-like beta-propeller repeat protein [Schlesneria paludicola]